MSKTIKQIADELGVSKPTISRIISDLGIEPLKIGNRFELSDADSSLIKTQISQIGETPQSQSNKMQKPLISLLETQISLLQSTIDTLQGQLTTKDEQIRMLQAQLIAKDEQIGQITAAMESTAAALTAAQALHAVDKKNLMLIEDKENERKLSFWERRAAKKAEKANRKDKI